MMWLRRWPNSSWRCTSSIWPREPREPQPRPRRSAQTPKRNPVDRSARETRQQKARPPVQPRKPQRLLRLRRPRRPAARAAAPAPIAARAEPLLQIAPLSAPRRPLLPRSPIKNDSSLAAVALEHDCSAPPWTANQARAMAHDRARVVAIAPAKVTAACANPVAMLAPLAVLPQSRLPRL